MLRLCTALTARGARLSPTGVVWDKLYCLQRSSSASATAPAVPVAPTSARRNRKQQAAPPALVEEHERLILYLEAFKGVKVHGLRKHDRELSAAIARLTELQRCGVPFNARDFMLTFQACRAGGLADAALSIVQCMPLQNATHTTISAPLDIQHCVAVLGCCNTEGHVRRTLATMCDGGIAHNWFTLTAAMHACVHRTFDVKTALALLEDPFLADASSVISNGERKRRTIHSLITLCGDALRLCYQRGDYMAARQVLGRLRQTEPADQGVAGEDPGQLAKQGMDDSRAAGNAIRLGSPSESPLHVPNLFMYNQAIGACARAPIFSHALQLLDEMAADGVQPDARTYSAAITACGRCGRPDEALRLLGEMRASQLACSDHCYSAAIAACGAAGRWEDALESFEQLRQALINDDAGGSHPSSHAFAAAINASGANGQATLALDLFYQMRVDDSAADALVPRPDQACFRAVLKSCGASGEWEDAVGIIKRLVEASEASPAVRAALARQAQPRSRQRTQHARGRQRPPTSQTKKKSRGTHAARGTGRRGSSKVDDSDCLVVPTSEMYCDAIASCRRAGQWQAALQLLRGMRGDSDRGCAPAPTTECYNAAIAACSLSNVVGRKETGKLYRAALSLLDEMQQLGVPRDIITYNACLGACCAAGAADGGVEAAERTLLAMVSDELAPDRVTFERLGMGCPENMNDSAGAGRKNSSCALDVTVRLATFMAAQGPPLDPPVRAFAMPQAACRRAGDFGSALQLVQLAEARQARDLEGGVSDGDWGNVTMGVTTTLERYVLGGGNPGRQPTELLSGRASYIERLREEEEERAAAAEAEAEAQRNAAEAEAAAGGGLFKQWAIKLGNSLGRKLRRRNVQEEIDICHMCMLTAMHKECLGDGSVPVKAMEGERQHVVLDRARALDFEQQQAAVALCVDEQLRQLFDAADATMGRQARLACIDGGVQDEELHGHAAVAQSTAGAARALRRELGFALRVHRWPRHEAWRATRGGRPHPSSVFLDGRAEAGSVVALFPGKVYMPEALDEAAVATLDNPFVASRFDGVCIDGSTAATLPPNPFAVAHLVRALRPCVAPAALDCCCSAATHPLNSPRAPFSILPSCPLSFFVTGESPNAGHVAKCAGVRFRF
jgi:pentatricopeptide repeat protein